MSLIAVIAGFVAAVAVLVLPGLGVLQLAQVPQRSVGEELAGGVLATTAVLAVSGLLPLGLGMFSPVLIAVACLVMSLVGLVRLAGFVSTVDPKTWLAGGFAALLAVPVILTTRAEGWTPGDTFQWFYWELGRTLSENDGRPSLVAEYGTFARFQPDYLIFNVASEGYASMLFGLDEATALVVWRSVPALLGVGIFAALLRLWLRPTGALCGAALFVAIELWEGKFNAYKPESIGLIVTGAATLLMLTALRDRDRRRFLVSATGIGASVAVHTIAAVAIVLLLGAGILVWIFSGETPLSRLRQWVPVVVAGMVLALVSTGLIGWAFQGRVLVAADAGNPAEVSDDLLDPTYSFLLYSSAVFDDRPPPDGLDRVPGRARRPLYNVDLTRGLGLVAPGLIIFGTAFVAFADPDERRRRGARTVLVWAALVGSVVAFFALSFDTYVPQNTGTSRLAQYLPLVAVFGSACIVDAAAAALGRRTRPSARASVVAMGATVAVFGGLALHSSAGNLADNRPVGEGGRDAIEWLVGNAERDEVVIANVPTFGLFETTTGLEAPNEGRQPLIEAADFLRHTNASLRATNDFFVDPANAPVPYGAEWIVVTDDPLELAGRRRFGDGDSVARVQRALGEAPAFVSGPVSVFHVEPGPQPTAEVTTIRAPMRTLAVGGIWALAVAALGAGRVRRARADQGDGSGAM